VARARGALARASEGRSRVGAMVQAIPSSTHLPEISHVQVRPRGQGLEGSPFLLNKLLASSQTQSPFVGGVTRSQGELG